MKLTRSQKASLLKEIGNLISYFQTFEHMDVDKLINIMKEKYSSWKDAKVEDLHNDVNNVVITIQKLIEERVVETDTTTNSIDVEITGGNASTFENEVVMESQTLPASHVIRACMETQKEPDCLSSEPTIFKESQYWNKIDIEDEEIANRDDFTFTAFNTFDDPNYCDKNYFSITFKEFWSDEPLEADED